MTAADTTPAIVCLAHLGWDFVWQRPQQILSRLAAQYPVQYINEPRLRRTAAGQPSITLIARAGGVTAWQPLFPRRPDICESWNDLYSAQIVTLLVAEGWLQPVQTGYLPTRPLLLWFYTPMPVDILSRLPANLVIYDVMDELANFKGAPPELPHHEAQLLKRADLVFTGGKSIYEARRGRNPHVHLFPSGVDHQHFAAALSPATVLAPELAQLPRPILGYYGVIDERLDRKLIDQLAARRTDWTLVFIGPVTKIRKSSLPRRPNIFYLGQQPYERLPGFLKGFDVCLMPFAINQATRGISPTKTLEYMAAHKPIVSTPVPDVVACWGDVVRIAAAQHGDPTAFIAAVEQALGEDEHARAVRQARETVFLEQHSWARIVSEMEQLIREALSR